jgi:hypothetical protein
MTNELTAHAVIKPCAAITLAISQKIEVSRDRARKRALPPLTFILILRESRGREDESSGLWRSRLR